MNGLSLLESTILCIYLREEMQETLSTTVKSTTQDNIDSHKRPLLYKRCETRCSEAQTTAQSDAHTSHETNIHQLTKVKGLLAFFGNVCMSGLLLEN